MTDADCADGTCDIVANPRLRALVRYWGEKRGDRSMPSRGDIDPVEIPRLLSIVLLADATRRPPVIQLLGTEPTAAYGQEMRGRPVDAFEFNGFSPAWLKAFDTVARSGLPTAAAGAHTDSTRCWMVEVVLTPLSNDGEHVQQIFGGLYIKPIKAGCEPSQQSVVHILPIADQTRPQRERSSR